MNRLCRSGSRPIWLSCLVKHSPYFNWGHSAHFLVVLVVGRYTARQALSQSLRCAVGEKPRIPLWAYENETAIWKLQVQFQLKRRGIHYSRKSFLEWRESPLGKSLGPLKIPPFLWGLKVPSSTRYDWSDQGRVFSGAEFSFGKSQG